MCQYVSPLIVPESPRGASHLWINPQQLQSNPQKFLAKSQTLDEREHVLLIARLEIAFHMITESCLQ